MTVFSEPVRTDSPPPEHPGRRFTPARVLGVLVVPAAAAALILGVMWALTLTDDSRELAEARDVVLVEARSAAKTLNTLDFRNVASGLDAWEAVSTGVVLDEFRTNRAQYEQVVGESRRVTEAAVTDAAVVELDLRAGVARVLAGVDVTVRPEGEEPVITRQRLQMEMTRTEQGWKVSRLAPVPTP